MSLPIYIQVIVNGRSQNIVLQSGEQVTLGRDTVIINNKKYRFHWRLVSRDSYRLDYGNTLLPSVYGSLYKSPVLYNPK